MRVVLLSLAVFVAGACERRTPTPTPPTGRAPAQAPASLPTHETFRTLRPLPREKGPARKETPQAVAATIREARSFTQQMVSGQISRREVTAMADIRGYRLYRQRYFEQAHAWFEAAIRVDPSYELSLFNAARTAALTKRLKRAREHLESLRRLDTPLARDRLARAARNTDFKAIHSTP
ncbi:MAG: hypothetical protein JRH20_02795 [Deltaproteobacteria bacterium]|nr:hypothetical protein [Deltaproteobacteria bacterium]